mgnify:CR=1 FL=1
MPTCNSSRYYGNWTLIPLITDSSPSLKGWKDFASPKMRVTFDAQTANYTLYADFAAFPFLRSNDSEYIADESPEQQAVPQILGSIRFTSTGVLDGYHSDVLNMNTSSPTWLRTVGFGNNSLNIANSAVDRSHPGLGAATIVVAFTIFVMFY